MKRLSLALIMTCIMATTANGHLIYVGTVPSMDILQRLVTRAAERKGISNKERESRFPIILRSGVNEKGKAVHYIFNYSYEEQTLNYPFADSRSLLDSQSLKAGQTVSVEPWGVVIGVEK